MPACQHTFRTRFSRSSARHALTVVAAAVLLATTSMVHAGADRYQKCDEGRYNAAADYAACQQRVLGNFFGNYATVKYDHLLAFQDNFQAARSKCHVTYTNTWPLHVGKVSDQPSACDSPRFLDNGDGTVTDELTGLQWEKKTDDGSIHDKDNRYSWGVDLYGAGETNASDGTVYTAFLATLNSSGNVTARRSPSGQIARVRYTSSSGRGDDGEWRRSAPATPATDCGVGPPRRDEPRA